MCLVAIARTRGGLAWHGYAGFDLPDRSRFRTPPVIFIAPGPLAQRGAMPLPVLSGPCPASFSSGSHDRGCGIGVSCGLRRCQVEGPGQPHRSVRSGRNKHPLRYCNMRPELDLSLIYQLFTRHAPLYRCTLAPCWHTSPSENSGSTGSNRHYSYIYRIDKVDPEATGPRCAGSGSSLTH